MKRLLIALFLLICLAPAALAEITIIQQPETQTVEAGGSITFTVVAEGVSSRTAITWYFTDPDTGETVPGRKLASKVSGLKVRSANSLSITLKNVPASMHGWTLHCHLGKKGSGVDTDEVMILIAGQETAGEELSEAVAGAEEVKEEIDPQADEAEESVEPEESAGEESAEQEAAAESQPSAPAAGSNDGNSCEQIRGWDGTVSEDYEKQYQYLQLGTYYYEEDGGRAPLVWRVLYRKENIAQLVTEQVVDAMQMIKIDDFTTAVKKRNYKSKYNTPYEETDLYYWLNGEMARVMFENQDFSSAIVPHRITESVKGETDVAVEPGYQETGSGDMTAEEREKFPYGKDLFYILTYADMKNEDFGFPKTTPGNTKENEGEIAVPESGRRKAFATPYAKAKVQYPDWKKNTSRYKLDVVTVYKGMGYGGSSPYWAIKRRPGYYMSGIVGANGHLSWSNMASVRIGVRPATIVDLSRLEVTGGAGTLDNPWIMSVTGK